MSGLLTQHDALAIHVCLCMYQLFPFNRWVVFHYMRNTISFSPVDGNLHFSLYLVIMKNCYGLFILTFMWTDIF